MHFPPLLSLTSSFLTQWNSHRSVDPLGFLCYVYQITVDHIMGLCLCTWYSLCQEHFLPPHSPGYLQDQLKCDPYTHYLPAIEHPFIHQWEDPATLSHEQNIILTTLQRDPPCFIVIYIFSCPSLLLNCEFLKIKEYILCLYSQYINGRNTKKKGKKVGMRVARNGCGLLGEGRTSEQISSAWIQIQLVLLTCTYQVCNLWQIT